MNNKLKSKSSRDYTLVLSIILPCLFVALTLKSSDGQADPPPEDASLGDISALFNMSLEELMKIEVTSSGVQANTLADAPGSVTVFTEFDIRAMGLTTLEQLLPFIPGMATYRADGLVPYNFEARGQLRGTGGDVLLLINGRYANDLLAGSANYLIWEYPLEHVSRVEVVRGPAGATHGSGALMATINLVTKTSGTRATVSGGTRGQRSYSMLFTQGLGSNPENKVTLYARMATDPGLKYKYDLDATGAKDVVVQHAHDGADTGGSVSYNNFSVDWNYSHRRRTGGLYYGLATQPPAQMDHKANNLSVFGSYKLQLTEQLRLSSTLGFIYQDQSSWGAFNVIPQERPWNLGIAFQAYRISGTVLATYDNLLPGDNSFAVGVSYNRDDRPLTAYNANLNRRTLEFFDRTRMLTAPEETFQKKAAARQIMGLFAEHTQHIGDYLNLLAGLRYDYYSDVGGALVPRLMVEYNAPFGSRAKAMYSRSFRAPSFYELYDRNNLASYGNENLNPEISDTVELSVSHTMKDLWMTLTGYRTILRSIIAQDPTDIPTTNNFGGYKWKNSDQTGTFDGVELSARYQLLRELSIYAAYAMVINTNSALGVAKHKAAFFADYLHEFFGINISATYRSAPNLVASTVEAKRKADGLPALDTDPSLLLNGNVRYIIGHGISINLAVQNLLDKRFKQSSAGLSAIPHIWDGGRTILFGLSYE